MACAIAALCAFVLRFGIDGDLVGPADLVAAALLPAAWAAAAGRRRAYDLRFAGIGAEEFVRTFRAFLDLAFATAMVSYAAHLDLARGFLLVALPLTLLLSWTGRYVARVRLYRLRRAGEAMNRVLAVGSSSSVFALARAMQRDVYAGLHVVAACLPDDEVTDIAAVRRLGDLGIEVLGATGDVRTALSACRATSVAVVAGDIGPDLVRNIAWNIEGSGADLIMSSGLTEVAGGRVHVQTVAGQPLLRVDEPTFNGLRRFAKGTFDRCAAALALLVLSPVARCPGGARAHHHSGSCLLPADAGRAKRRAVPDGEVPVDARRCGREVHALAARNDMADGLLFKIQNDPRVTPIGRVLRRFSLDELPQLFNVVTGSMSLVGPRPPLPEEVALYGQDVRRRLLVKPGLTGVWQVSGRSDLSWDESVRLDLHYVENWTFGAGHGGLAQDGESRRQGHRRLLTARLVTLAGAARIAV